MIDFHFDTSIYKQLGDQTKLRLQKALVEFTKETLAKAEVPKEHTWLVLYGVFPLGNKDTGEIKTYLGVKIFIDLNKFKEQESFDAISIIEVDQHDSEVPDELLDFYNKTKEFNPQIVDLNL